MRQILAGTGHNERNFGELDATSELGIEFMGVGVWKDQSNVMEQLPFFGVTGFFLLNWVHEFCNHLCIFFGFNFEGIGSFHRLTLGGFMLLFQVLGLVVVVSAFLHIETHF
jgi:hypothetical protein